MTGLSTRNLFLQVRQINAKFYCNVLRWLREDMRRKWPDKWCVNKCVLHNNNEPAHNALVVQQFLASKNMMVIPPSTLLPWVSPLWLLALPQDENQVEGVKIWHCKGDWGQTAEDAEDDDTKGLLEQLPIIAETLGSSHSLPRVVTLKGTVVTRTSDVSYFSSDTFQEPWIALLYYLIKVFPMLITNNTQDC